MNRFFLIFLFVLPGSNCFSQDKDTLSYSEQRNNGIKYSLEPLLIINADEIRRYPANDFLSAIEGVFPGIFELQAGGRNFLYIVDGSTTIDINGLNLNDIETIAFSRNNAFGGIFPLSTTGTFFITTKKHESDKWSVSFNTKQNILFNSQQKLYTPSPSNPYIIPTNNELNNGIGYYSGNHLSVSKSGKKFNVYTSGYFDNTQLPSLKQKADEKSSYDTLTRVYDAMLKRNFRAYGLFLHADYTFSSKLQAGIKANYAGRKITYDSLGSTYFVNHSLYSTTGDNPFKLISLAGSLKWQPVNSFANELTVEYNHKNFAETMSGEIKMDYASTHISIFQLDRFKSNVTLIKDEITYHLWQRSNWKTELSFNGFWYHIKTSEEADHRTISSTGGFNIGNSFSSAEQKVVGVNPAVYTSYKNLVNAYAGLGYFIETKYNSSKENKGKAHPYAGINFNLKNLFEGTDQLASLNLSLNYSNLPVTFSNFPIKDFLPFYSRNPLFGYWDLNSRKTLLSNNSLTTIKLSAGSLQQRFLAEAEFGKLSFVNVYLLTLPDGYGGQTAYYNSASERLKWFSFSMSTRLMEKSKLKLSLRLNLFMPVTKADIAASNAGRYVDQTSITAGIQQRWTYKKSFLQLNSIFNFNQRYLFNFPDKPEKSNFFTLRNIVFGCQPFSNSSTVFKNSTLFIQAANIVSSNLSNYYNYNKQIGVGLNLEL